MKLVDDNEVTRKDEAITSYEHLSMVMLACYRLNL